MKGVQCYELFGGIALKIHAFFYACPLASVFCSLIGESAAWRDGHLFCVRFLSNVYTGLNNGPF